MTKMSNPVFWRGRDLMEAAQGMASEVCRRLGWAARSGGQNNVSSVNDELDAAIECTQDLVVLLTALRNKGG